MMEYALHLMLVGTLRNHNGNANENIAWKYKFALRVLRDYSNSFNLYNVAELSSNRTGGNGIQVETEIKKITVMCSHSPQNFEFGYFNVTKCTKIYNACARPLFSSLYPIDLWRSRSGRCSSFLKCLVLISLLGTDVVYSFQVSCDVLS